MKKVVISIVYHNNKGQTEQLANYIANEIMTEQAVVHLLSVADAKAYFQPLLQSDTIVGQSSYFRNMSAAFNFMEATWGLAWQQMTILS